VGTPRPAPDDDHALFLMLVVLHGLARFVDGPDGCADVDLVAREWDRPRPAEELSVRYGRPPDRPGRLSECHSRRIALRTLARSLSEVGARSFGPSIACRSSHEIPRSA
jgi:hypothetical protein